MAYVVDNNSSPPETIIKFWDVEFSLKSQFKFYKLNWKVVNEYVAITVHFFSIMHYYFLKYKYIRLLLKKILKLFLVIKNKSFVLFNTLKCKYVKQKVTLPFKKWKV